MKRGLFLFFVFCAISNGYASDECLQRPSCEELGYVQTRKKCACFNKDVLPCPFNINDDNTVFCGDLDCAEKCQSIYPVFAGKENTKAAVDQIGTNALAAYAAMQFYVGDKNGDFGQGKWYLPSIGEWMDFYGIDIDKITNGQGSSGALGNTVKLLNETLTLLSNNGVKASPLKNQYYWSSTENESYASWAINAESGYRIVYKQYQPNLFVRVATRINFENNETARPTVGDILYINKSFGSIANYDGSIAAVGVVASVSKQGNHAIIVNLDDLTFTSSKNPENFNPEAPYQNSPQTQWAVGGYNITEIEDIYSASLVALLQSSCNCSCQFYQPE